MNADYLAIYLIIVITRQEACLPTAVTLAGILVGLADIIISIWGWHRSRNSHIRATLAPKPGGKRAAKNTAPAVNASPA